MQTVLNPKLVVSTQKSWILATLLSCRSILQKLKKTPKVKCETIGVYFILAHYGLDDHS